MKGAKTIFHPKFARDIQDPSLLATQLPYLPGKRIRDQKKKENKAKQQKTIQVETSSTPKRKVVPGVSLGIRKKERTRRVLVAKSDKANSIVNTVTPQSTIKQTTKELKVTPQRKVSTRIPKKSTVTPNRGGGKDIKTLISTFKTPSPRYRHGDSNFMSSPPPLSHYLQPKNVDPNKKEMTEAGAKVASRNESPLPSSLLTVNFVMSPSALVLNNEKTPRTSNLSSSQSSPMSQDGFKMLSWAAKTVESPLKTIRTHTPDSKTNVRFMEALGCSPIVPSGSKGSLVEAIHKCCPPSSQSTSSNSTRGASSVASRKNKEIAGTSPLSFRGHDENEHELELLRNCLEDVFVATSGGNMPGRVVQQQKYPSVAVKKEDVN